MDLDLLVLVSRFHNSGVDERLVDSLRDFVSTPPREVAFTYKCYIDHAEERLDLCPVIEPCLRAREKSPFL